MMSVRNFTFDPEGDLLLRLHYPKQAGTFTPAPSPVDLSRLALHEANTSESSSSAEITSSAHMLVSSQHLILASPVFKAMFRSGFRESILLASSENAAEIDLPEDDPEGFEVFMNIVHGHVRKVPSEISLEMLAKLSVIVDKYQAVEVMDLYVRMWLPELRKILGQGGDVTILYWLSISWVFKLPEDFRKWTMIVQLGACKSLSDRETDLPTPSLVFDAIESVREGVISSIMTLLDGVIEQYSTGPVQCATVFAPDIAHYNTACDALILGSLIRSLSRNGLWPLPKAPYKGVSILWLVPKISKIEILCFCFSPKPDGGEFADQPSAHGLNKRIQHQMSTAHAGVRGLDLATVALPTQSAGTSSGTST